MSPFSPLVDLAQVMENGHGQWLLKALFSPRALLSQEPKAKVFVREGWVEGQVGHAKAGRHEGHLKGTTNPQEI